MFARSLLPKLGAPVSCRTCMGFELVVSAADGPHYYYDGCYEAGTLHVMSRCLRRGDTFVDVGASIGQMTMHAASLVGAHGRVLSFEPHPGRHRGLMQGAALNRFSQIVAYKTGLGEDACVRALYTDRVSPSLTEPLTPSTCSVPVQTLRLDVVAKWEALDSVRMMKLDVEGFELQALKGAGDLLRGDGAPILCLEYDQHGGAPDAPIEYLQSVNDYRFFNLSRTKARASKLKQITQLEKLRLGDNVFCLLDRHVRELSGTDLLR